MSETIPLLPCPWCGSEDVHMVNDDNARYVEMEWDCNFEAVRCFDCKALGPITEQDQIKAVALWNKGPYADRWAIHAEALLKHAKALRAKADEHLAKADELIQKAKAAEGMQ